MSTPEEFKQKIPISIGAIVFVGFICFNLGILYATLLGAKDDIVINKRAAKEYTEQEVGGLRADWERKNKDIDQRLDALEPYHRE